MVNNQDNIETEEYKNLSYNELSDIIRQKAKVTGKTFIPILYEKLLEERKTPKEAKLLLEHDFKDIWSTTYINEFIPPEAKDEQKVKAGKKGQKKKQEIQISNEGKIIEDSAKLSQAELSPVSQNKPEYDFKEKEDFISNSDLEKFREEKGTEEEPNHITDLKFEGNWKEDDLPTRQEEPILNLEIDYSRQNALKFANDLRMDILNKIDKNIRIRFMMNKTTLSYKLF